MAREEDDAITLDSSDDDERRRPGDDTEDEELEAEEQEGSGSSDDNSENDEDPDVVRKRRREALFPAVSAAVAALGGFEDTIDDETGELVSEFTLGDYPLACLKDLRRFLQMTDGINDRPCLRIFHDLNFVRLSLLPLLAVCNRKTDIDSVRIAMASVELLTVITEPILPVDEMREEQAKAGESHRRKTLTTRAKRTEYSSLIHAQRIIKRDVLRSTAALRDFMRVLAKPVSKNRRERSEKDMRLIHLILTLLRNLAVIKDYQLTGGSIESASVESMELATLQSEYIRQLHSEKVFPFLLSVSSSLTREWERYTFVILEFFATLFRHVQPADMFTTAPSGGRDPSTGHTAADDQLLSLLSRDAVLGLTGSRGAAAAGVSGIKQTSRHSRFGTTLAVRHEGRQYVVHRQSAVLDGGKGARKVMDDVKRKESAKGRGAKGVGVLATDETAKLASRLESSAVKVLKEVAIQFIESCFNPFFGWLLKDIRAERVSATGPHTAYFLYLSSWFMDFFLRLRRDVGLEAQDKVKLKQAKEKKEKAEKEAAAAAKTKKAAGASGEEEGEPAEAPEEPKEDADEDEELYSFHLIAEMTELHAIGFVIARVKTSYDERATMNLGGKRQTELHAGVDCFNQILLVIDALGHSPNPEHSDVAEVLQNKLYYEAETLDMVIKLVEEKLPLKYGKRYLESTITLVYTLLRLLEKYSKSKAYMYVRKKRNTVNRRSKQRKDKAADGADDQEAIEDDEENEADWEYERRTKSISEHAFEFEIFERKIAQETTLTTCIAFLEGYKFFTSSDQMKKVVSLMHRMAVKAKAETLFFRPSVLELFRRIVADKRILPQDQPYKDLQNLIIYVFRVFVIAVQARPLVLVEAFFPKTKSVLENTRQGAVDPYADSSDDDVFLFNAKKRPAEVEVAGSFTLTQQIGILIAVLVEDDELHLIEAVKTNLSVAAAARQQVVMMTDGVTEKPRDEMTDEEVREAAARLAGPSKDARDKFADHKVTIDGNIDEKKILSTHSNLKALMRLLNWKETEAPQFGLVWTIPADVMPGVLEGDIRIIDQFLADPLEISSGKRASDLLKKKRKQSVRRRLEAQRSEEEYSDDGDDGEPSGRGGKKLKRKGKGKKRSSRSDDDDDDVDETSKEERKRKKKQKKVAQQQLAYKSAQFIEDSDEDEDEEKKFYERERALRAQLDAAAVAGVGSAAANATKKKGKPSTKGKKADKGKGKGKATSGDDDDEIVIPKPFLPHIRKRSKKKKQANSSDADGTRSESSVAMSDDSDSDTEPAPAARKNPAPSSSTAQSSPPPTESSAPASSMPVKVTRPSSDVSGSGSEKEEEAAPKKKRKVILDSDDE